MARNDKAPEQEQPEPQRHSDDAGLRELQAQADKDVERGFRGLETDSTPNENYTVEGVLSGAPTPETDKAQAEKVRTDQVELEGKAEGVGKAS